MKKIILLLTLSCFWYIGLKAQTPTYIDTDFNINAGAPVTWYGDVTFGPNAVVYIENGAVAFFYGKTMTVNSSTKFIALPGNNQIGTGTIIFKDNNPMYDDYPQQQTLNGGYTASGASPTFINIEIDNAAGVSLAGNVRIANQLRFSKGHLYLNNFNAVLGSEAILSGISVAKHIVTNASGVITKEDLPANSSFDFPVSIAGYDFTPAKITNGPTARNISVQVKDYTNSVANETTIANRGIDRTWQISSNIAGTATVSLQHNAANNINGIGTNQSLFNNTLAYVTQQIKTGDWYKTFTGADGGSPTSLNFGNFNIPAVIDATAYFTKTSAAYADLQVTKSVNSVSPKVGTNVVFTIDVKNLGVIDATGVLVNELLPTGYTYVSSTPSVGTYNSTNGVWTIGNLANAATAKLTITAKINVSGNYTNIASIKGDQDDADTTNNTSAPVTVTPGALQANLDIKKTVDNSSPIKGNNVVFTIDVVNNGPDNATNVKVTDVLPTGYTYVANTASIGTYNNSTGIWTIGGLNNAATAKLTITATVNTSGVYNNTATIAADEADPVTGNNTSTAIVTPNAALVDLSIEKKAPTLQGIAIGDEFDYTIVVKNIGTQLASGVVATDVLPASLAYVANNATVGTVNYNSGNKTVSWNIGDLAVGANITLTLRVKAILPGLVTNVASVTSTQADLDNKNNTSQVDKDILDLTFPNVITPNGDGKNDTFKVLGLNAYPENTMSIYNRWNNEVWHSTASSYQNEWNGNQLSEGTYFYVIKLKDKTGATVVFKGWVTLLKD